MPYLFTLRGVGFAAVASGVLFVSACANENWHFSLLGYTTEPNYDTCIKTVYVPIFQNESFRRGLEFDLQRAIVREIESKTPYRVSNNRAGADSELLGKIIVRTKSVINANQMNEVREAEATLAVEVLWRDLRVGHCGDVLSQPRGEPVLPLPNAPPPAGTPGVHPLLPPPPPPILITAIGRFIPELGGSITSAEKQMIDSLAVQIVSMMERAW